MKKILVVAGLLAVIGVIALVVNRVITEVRLGQRELFSETLTFDEAKDRASERDADILVLALATWCPYCKELDRNALLDDEVIETISERTVPLRVDISGRSVDLDRWPNIDRLRVRMVPTLILLDQNGRERDRITGVVEAQDLIAWIRSRGETKPRKTGGTGQLDS